MDAYEDKLARLGIESGVVIHRVGKFSDRRADRAAVFA